MKLCIVGIGGAGGKITSQFLQNVDLSSNIISKITSAEYVSPGRVTGIWLEADKDDAKNKQNFFKDLTEGGYPGFYIPHDVIDDGCDLQIMVKKNYGYNIKSQGFVRDAQYLKAIFEIFDTDEDIQKIAIDYKNTSVSASFKLENGSTPNTKNNNLSHSQIPNPIFDSAWESIRPYTILGDGECDGILFIVSLGGGTGTGFINPIVDHIREGGRADFPVFVLGILTEPKDVSYGDQPSREGQRYLAAISAIYDLQTKSNGADGIILIDNQILEKRAGSARKSQNKFIYNAMKPMIVGRDYPRENPVGRAMQKEFSRNTSWPPIFVPLYWFQARQDNPEEQLVAKAISSGKLFDCSPKRADKAIVFCRGFIDTEKIKQEIYKYIKLESFNIQVYRKMGEENDEILILLRNPYGEDSNAYRVEGTLENKFCKVINSALDYMNKNVADLFYEGEDCQKAAKAGEDVRLTLSARLALSNYFFGKEGYIKDNIGKTDGFAFELREAIKRLRDGETRIFLKSRRIFEKEIKTQDIENKPKSERFSLDEQEIVDIIDKRIDEKLNTLKIAK